MKDKVIGDLKKTAADVKADLKQVAADAKEESCPGSPPATAKEEATDLLHGRLAKMEEEFARLKAALEKTGVTI